MRSAPTFFEQVSAWESAELHTALQAWMKAQPEGRAAVQKSLRIALSGKSAGPPVAEIAHALGQAQTVARLHAALAWDAAHRTP